MKELELPLEETSQEIIELQCKGANFIIAEEYYNQREYKKALLYMKRAFKYDGNHNEYFALAGKIFYNLNQMDKAYAYALDVLRNDGNNIDAIVLAGLSCINMKRFDSCTDYLRRALDIAPDNKDVIYFETRYYIEADVCLDRCLRRLRQLYSIEKSINIKRDIRLIEKKIKAEMDEALEVDKKEPEKKEPPSHITTKSLEEAMRRLNYMTGLDEVKTQIEKIINYIKFTKKREELLGFGDKNSFSYHFAFAGNPGTGKTVTARLLSDIFYHLGIIEKGQLIECDRSSLVGGFVGQTATKTKQVVESALGGVLFIDEAYSLARGGSDSKDFGIEAIDTLLKEMEDKRGQFIVVLAGYKNEMNMLMDMNPGLKSRVNFHINFEDYKEQELLDIGCKMAANECFDISDDGRRALLSQLSRLKVDETFANARTVRNLIEKAIMEKASKIGDNEKNLEVMFTLTAQDFGVNPNEDNIEAASEQINELNEMCGLSNVKEEIRSFTNYLTIEKRRSELGMSRDAVSLNMIFTGNPGTGKTTVARSLAAIYRSLGILKKGHLVEAVRSDFIGSYAGQTAEKTRKKIKEAYGGILFIDEAYSLCVSENDTYGAECLSVLVKEMEDNRDKLVVIMAGYRDDMDKMIEMNKGLKSRIGKTINFEDYNPEELTEILTKLMQQNNYTMSNDARDELFKFFENEYQFRDERFGNARMVRGVFEKLKLIQSDRLVSEGFSDNDLANIKREDVIKYIKG